MKHTSTPRGKPLGIQDQALLCAASRGVSPLASTMRKIILGLVCLILTGCSTMVIPSYIKDQNPYKQKFYAEYGLTVQATEKALNEMGWSVEDRVDPSIYERNRKAVEGERYQILILTNVRKMPFMIGSRYARLNVYITSVNKAETEVEVRYLTIKSVGFKKMENYQADKIAKKILQQIEYYLD